MNALVEVPGKGLARRAAPKRAGLDLINMTIDSIAAPMEALDQCQFHLSPTSGIAMFVGEEEMDVSTSNGRYLTPARQMLNRLLPHYAKVRAGYMALSQIVFGSDGATTPAMAMKILPILFGALNKKKGDDENSAMKMLACADMFDTKRNRILAQATDVEAVPRHPVILALAIKQLIATQKFSPEPAELREAMLDVHAKIKARTGWWMSVWLQRMERADEIVFTFDREAWNAAYARVDSSVAQMMLDWGCAGEEGYEDDNHHDDRPPSPRWQALADLIAAKQAAEQTDH